MPQIQSSIVINGNIDEIFAITNDLERWPELFHEQHGVKVLSYDRHGRFARIEFQLTNGEGETWRSWRMLDFEKHVAIAQRDAPKYPFKYMHLMWSYEVVEGGVRMTCVEDFEMDPNAPFTNDQAQQRMGAHLEANQGHLKEVLERQFGVVTKA